MKKLAMILVILFWAGCIRAEGMNITKEYENKLVERVKQVYGLSPASYTKGLTHPICATPIMSEYGLVKNYLSQEARRELSFLDERPSYGANTEYTYDTPDGHFRIHYTKTGVDSVYKSSEDLNPADGHPDYVNRCAEVCERAWEIEIDSMGYHFPPSDSFYTPNGGNGRYDIYILSLEPGYLGWTSPENPLSSNAKSYTSYIVLRNDFSSYYFPPYYSSYLDGVEVTLAHEFFHTIQFGYDAYEQFADIYDFNSRNLYWMEMTAVWMEDVVYDEVSDYIWYLPYFFDFPWLSLKAYAHPDSDVIKFMHIYGSCIWSIYLGENYGKDIIRRIWEDCAEVMGSNSWQATANQVGDIQEAFRDFTVWNFFTGSRADTANYYSEGNLWPQIESNSIPEFYHNSYPIEADSVSSAYQPQGLAADYIFFKTLSDSVGGLRIEFDGYPKDRWRGSIIGYKAGDSTLVKAMAIFLENQHGTSEVVDWNEFDNIIFIPAHLNGDTFGVDFKYYAYYDSTLTVGTVLSNEVEVFQSSPNPFVIGERQQFVNFPIAVKGTTHVEIKIFTVAGELIKNLYSGNLEEGNHNILWNAKNEHNEDIASGIYLYQVKTDKSEVFKKMAVIRK